MATAYVYDGEGQRVRKLLGENTRFVYGMGGQLIMEFAGSSGSLTKEYVYGGGSLATIAPNGKNSLGVQYLTSDLLGTPRVITKADGSVAARHDCKPFGEEIFAGTGGRTTGMGFSASDGIRKKFTGYERDTETGLDFAQARYYSNTQARFTSPDPLAASASAVNPQSWNRYAYVGNNPLIMTDPTGMIASHESGNQYYRRHDVGVYGGAESWGRAPGPNETMALTRLALLAAEATKDGNKELAAGLEKAASEILSIIQGLRPGQENVGVNVAVNAILNIGNAKYSEAGTVTIGTGDQAITFGPSTSNKCNVLVAGAHADGAGLGFIKNGKTGKGYPLTDDAPPVANYLGDKRDSKHLTNLSVVTTLRVGDIVAWRNANASPDNPGHSSIYIGGGVVVYAGGPPDGSPKAQTLKYVNGHMNTEGWLGTGVGATHEPYVIRRYSGP